MTYTYTLPKTNIAPEHRPSQKENCIQPSIFRGYVKLWGGNIFQMGWNHQLVFFFFLILPWLRDPHLSWGHQDDFPIESTTCSSTLTLERELGKLKLIMFACYEHLGFTMIYDLCNYNSIIGNLFGAKSWHRIFTAKGHNATLYSP